ncbi:hypothetical protein ASC84_10850 [Acinetobacter sp. Root1280]|uniref:hypothetical protein n=1 Tax=Acinetobacter sp. Root1280 TaxID=1736444 RepID=UPI0006FDAC73|nr:hypothetical protein [Acinetobacter sp. Root1280]KQW89547.1 hypothetical protein ASC84_10850 [Acinetobacter sp. Root1280]
MNLSIKISNEDFFKLLKHKISLSYSTRYSGGLSEKVIFKETIDALKRINHFAHDVSDGIWDADLLTSRFRHQEDQLQLAEFCDSFNGIRLQKELFPTPEMFNHLFFKSVYEKYVQLDKNAEHEIRRKYGIWDYLPLLEKQQEEYAQVAFIYDTHLQIPPWVIRNIPYERIAQLISEVRNQIDIGMDEHRRHEKNALDKFNSYAEAFDLLLRTHSSTYVFTIDIKIQGFLTSRSDLMTQVGHVQDSPIHDIKLILARFPDLLNGLTKIETHGAKEDLNLHCILILKPSKNFSEKKSIDVLQQQIQNFLGNSYYVSIRNWNEVIRRNYSKIAVGLIKKSQPKNAEAFKYWVLSFFFILDLHIQPCLSSQLKYLAINETLDSYLNNLQAQSESQSLKNENIIESFLTEVEKANKGLSKNFQPFLSEKERKSVWSMRSLPKTSQAYIEAVMHYYREIEPAPEKLQSMMNIEIFIETLLSIELQAFELSVSDDQEVLTRQILNKAITRLGRQFILLGENEVDDLLHPRYAFLIQPFFEKSRDALQQLTGSAVPRHAIEEVNQLILVLRRLYTSSLKGIGNQSIQKISNHSYKKYIRRIDDITELLKHLFLQGCLVLRVTVELIPETKYISHPDLVILWTAFLHHAQRSKPLSRKTGFFGLWRVDEDQHFYADVFIVFDERAVVDRDSIIQQLNDKWVKFINNKGKSKLKLNEKTKFKHCRIQGKPLMIAEGEYASDHLFIESTNKARKSDFLQKIIPAFLSHSLFGEAYHETYKQTGSGLLIKSSIAVASRKNTPSTKSIRQKALKESVERSEVDDDQ